MNRFNDGIEELMTRDNITKSDIERELSARGNSDFYQALYLEGDMSYFTAGSIDKVHENCFMFLCWLILLNDEEIDELRNWRMT